MKGLMECSKWSSQYRQVSTLLESTRGKSALEPASLPALKKSRRHQHAMAWSMLHTLDDNAVGECYCGM